MCHASSKTSYGFHLLRVPKLFLQSLSLGHIIDVDKEGIHCSELYRLRASFNI